jgi:hypothetical protein
MGIHVVYEVFKGLTLMAYKGEIFQGSTNDLH